jgi:hypothetical protein
MPRRQKSNAKVFKLWLFRLGHGGRSLRLSARLMDAGSDCGSNFAAVMTALRGVKDSPQKRNWLHLTGKKQFGGSSFPIFSLVSEQQYS